MKLEPVYLVAKKRVPSMPTRRAFLFAGGTFVLGTSLGGACGYAMGVGAAEASAKPSDAALADEELKPSGDVELDELRRLAVKAPIEELVERRVMFVAAATRVYRRDSIVWKGVGRLCDALLTTPTITDRRMWAHFLAQEIELSEPAIRDQLLAKVGELRKVK